ncbi:envelope protein UL43 [Wood mouse herpesvirus]|uniref:Envelope protein UL43 n=1 Tax=Wood mouse herpesvirus TaxID=432370 RepID=D0U1P7_9GAMA|nr:envelope protein UL43 [Wood mouse herpesvirus]ACY41128.1 envelope protein UL43 [Wood mouse herpesvirus]
MNNHWSDVFLPLIVGGMSAVPFIWCLIFRTLYLPIECDWRCWIFVYGSLLWHITMFLSLLFKHKHGMIGWFKLCSAIAIFLVIVLALLEQYCSYEIYIVPVIFIINIVLLSIWVPMALISTYMCNRIYARLLELGFLTAIICYYVMLQIGAQESPAFWIPIPVLHIGGVYALLHFRTRPCFLHSVEKRHSIYYFGNHKYTVFPCETIMRMCSPEISLMIILIMMLAIGSPILAYYVKIVQGMQYFYMFLMLGPMVGGLIFDSKIVGTLFMILSFVTMIFAGMAPVWFPLTAERTFLISLMLANFAAGCFLECMRCKLRRAINGVYFVYLATVLYNLLVALIMIAVSI